MDEERFKKTCIKEKGKKGSIHQHFYCTCAADFMFRVKKSCKKVYAGNVFERQTIPWRRNRRLGMAVTGITPTASHLTKDSKHAAQKPEKEAQVCHALQRK